MASDIRVGQASGLSGQTANLPASGAAGIDRLANKETFLQLLVAQIRNQNPLNPADGTQFLTQLAQFSELEQMVQMRSDLEAIRGALEQAPSGALRAAPSQAKEF